MHRLSRVSLLLLLPLLSVRAQDAVHTSTVTLSVGGEFANGRVGEFSGPAFNGNYEFRWWKYIALEAGVDTFLPAAQSYIYEDFIYSGTNLTNYYSPGSGIFIPESGRTRVTLLPFGVKGILPLANGRLELFADWAAPMLFMQPARITTPCWCGKV